MVCVRVLVSHMFLRNLCKSSESSSEPSIWVSWPWLACLPCLMRVFYSQQASHPLLFTSHPSCIWWICFSKIVVTDLVFFISHHFGTLGLWCLSPKHFLKDRELHSDPLDARRWKETASNPTEVEGGGGGFAPETEFWTLENQKLVKQTKNQNKQSIQSIQSP